MNSVTPNLSEEDLSFSKEIRRAYGINMKQDIQEYDCIMPIPAFQHGTLS